MPRFSIAGVNPPAANASAGLGEAANEGKECRLVEESEGGDSEDLEDVESVVLGGTGEEDANLDAGTE